MENKQYYTPDLEDLFIGYECEVKQHGKSNEDWHKHTIYAENIYDVESNYIDVRTPYLSKEDIEKEGFKKVKENEREIFELIVPQEGFNEWKYVKVYLEDGYKIKITETFESSWANFTNTVFHGECKSVNELRKIKKWLKIIN